MRRCSATQIFLADLFMKTAKTQTKATLNDTVGISILFKNGKEMTWNLPVIENQIAGKIQLENEPLSLLIDPKVKFINISYHHFKGNSIWLTELTIASGLKAYSPRSSFFAIPDRTRIVL